MLKRILFLFLLCLWQCKSTHKTSPSGIQTSTESVLSSSMANTAPALTSSLVSPNIYADNFIIGALILARLLATPPSFSTGGSSGVVDYYDYDLCDKKSSSSCFSGKLLWNSKIFPTLSPGDYDASIKPCNVQLPDTEEVCGVESHKDVSQPNNPQNELQGFIQQELQVTGQIKAKASDIMKAYQAYKDQVFAKTAPTDPLSESVATQLAYGPDVIAELVNSSAYVSYFEQFYGTPIMSTQEQVAAGVITSADVSQIAAMQAQLQVLQQQVAKMSGNTTNTAAITGGTVLISLGSIAVTAGLIMGGISWYMPYLVDKKEVELRKFVDEKVWALNSKIEETINAWMREVLNGKEAVIGKIPNDAIEQLQGKLRKLLAEVQVPLEAKLSSLLDDVEKIVKEELPVVADLAEAEIKKGVLIDRVMNEIRKIAHGASDFDIFPDIEFLKKYYGGEAHFAIKYRQEGNIIYALPRSEGQSFEFYVERDSVYKLGDGLSILPEISNLNPISLEEFTKLQAQQQAYYEKDGEVYKLKKDCVLVDGKVYIKKSPFKMTVFPQLSSETLENLRNNLSRLERARDIDAGKNFGKGIPLIDVYGRLVRPPEEWLVAGQNWPNENVIVQGRNASQQPIQPNIEGLKIPKGVQYTDYTQSKFLQNPNKFYEPQPQQKQGVANVIESVKRSVLPVNLTAWRFEIQMQFAREFLQVSVPQYKEPLLFALNEQVGNIANMARAELKEQIKKQVFEKLDVMIEELNKKGLLSSEEVVATMKKELSFQIEKQFEIYSEKGKKKIFDKIADVHEAVHGKIGEVKDTITTHSKSGLKAGAFTAAVGIASIAAGSVLQQLGLAADSPSQTLQSTLKGIEDSLAILHKQRLQILGNINNWLRSNNYTPPDNEWVYHL